MEIILNVGLAVPGLPGELLSVGSVHKALGIFGVEAISAHVRSSSTEPTFVALLSRALSPEEARDVSDLLGQDCIAQRVDGVGALHGCNAAAWGEFNPEFFLV